MNKLPWDEKVNQISIHPEAAGIADIARMASELIEYKEYSITGGEGMNDESLELIKRAEVLIYNNPMTSKESGASLQNAIKWLVDAKVYLRDNEKTD